VSISIDAQTGALAITGAESNDIVSVFKQPSASTPGGYVLSVAVLNDEAPQSPDNCVTYHPNHWLVSCPALNVTRITFDGKLGGDGFTNNTGLPSEAHGGPGLDVFNGGTGADVFSGEDGDDILDGNLGDDTLDGGDGVNQITGGPGADTLNAGAGKDVLRGEGGNDTLIANPGADVLDGGADTDTLSYAGYPSVYVYQDGAANDGQLDEHDNVTSIENLTGSSYGDDLQGTQGDDVIHGGGGGDKIEAFFGDDTIYGGDGYDNIIPGPGPPSSCGNDPCTKFDTDTVYGGAEGDTVDYSGRSDDIVIALDGSAKSGGFMENDTLVSIDNAVAGDGNDTIIGNTNPNSLVGGGGNDGIDGKGGNDYLSGEGGNDWLGGGPGNDWVTGGDGADTLWAPGGNDTLYGGPGKDEVSYSGATAGVTAHLGTGTSGQVGEADAIESDVEDLQGSMYDDTLYGSSIGNHITGLSGKDTLVGNGGADKLEGNEGADILNSNGDGKQDTSLCGAGGDTANADTIDSVAPDCETVHKS